MKKKVQWLVLKMKETFHIYIENTENTFETFTFLMKYSYFRTTYLLLTQWLWTKRLNEAQFVHARCLWANIPNLAGMRAQHGVRKCPNINQICALWSIKGGEGYLRKLVSATGVSPAGCQQVRSPTANCQLATHVHHKLTLHSAGFTARCIWTTDFSV